MAYQKTKEGAAPADATAPELCAEYKTLYEKATLAKETAWIQKDSTATEMFSFRQIC
jgi:hypothetical protein